MILALATNNIRYNLQLIKIERDHRCRSSDQFYFGPKHWQWDVLLKLLLLLLFRKMNWLFEGLNMLKFLLKFSESRGKKGRGSSPLFRSNVHVPAHTIFSVQLDDHDHYHSHNKDWLWCVLTLMLSSIYSEQFVTVIISRIIPLKIDARRVHLQILTSPSKCLIIR